MATTTSKIQLNVQVLAVWPNVAKGNTCMVHARPSIRITGIARARTTARTASPATCWAKAHLDDHKALGQRPPAPEPIRRLSEIEAEISISPSCESVQKASTTGMRSALRNPKKPETIYGGEASTVQQNMGEELGKYVHQPWPLAT